MSDPGLDVPVQPIRSADRTGRGALVVATVALAVVAGLALLPGTSPETPPAAAELPAPASDEERATLSDRQPATGPARPTSTHGAGPKAGPAPSAPAAALPSFPSEELPGAPVVVFVRRAGDDAELLGWRSGELGLGALATFPGAFARLDARATLAQPAPDGRLLLVRVIGRSGGRADRYRLVDRAGAVLWERGDLPFPSSVAWSDDASALAVTGADGWVLVEIGDDGRVTERLVAIPPPGAPTPSADAAPLLPFSASTVPVAFSRDGRSIYGAAISFDGPLYAPAIRVSRADGTITPITAYPVGGADGVATGRGAGGRIDPSSGRLFEVAREGGIAVHEPDGRLAFRVTVADRPVLLGAAWAGDGRLLAFVADRLGRPDAVDLVPLDAAGQVGPALLSAGPVAAAGLAGARDGFVVLGVGGESAAVLVLLRASDGATSTLRLEPAAFGEIVGLDLLPAEPR